jgi:hypothetical protein
MTPTENPFTSQTIYGRTDDEWEMEGQDPLALREQRAVALGHLTPEQANQHAAVRQIIEDWEYEDPIDAVQQLRTAAVEDPENAVAINAAANILLKQSSRSRPRPPSCRTGSFGSRPPWAQREAEVRAAAEADATAAEAQQRANEMRQALADFCGTTPGAHATKDAIDFALQRAVFNPDGTAPTPEQFLERTPDTPEAMRGARSRRLRTARAAARRAVAAQRRGRSGPDAGSSRAGDGGEALLEDVQRRLHQCVRGTTGRRGLDREPHEPDHGREE